MIFMNEGIDFSVIFKPQSSDRLHPMLSFTWVIYSRVQQFGHPLSKKLLQLISKGAFIVCLLWSEPNAMLYYFVWYSYASQCLF